MRSCIRRFCRAIKLRNEIARRNRRCDIGLSIASLSVGITDYIQCAQKKNLFLVYLLEKIVNFQSDNKLTNESVIFTHGESSFAQLERYARNQKLLVSEHGGETL